MDIIAQDEIADLLMNKLLVKNFSIGYNLNRNVVVKFNSTYQKRKG